jgi:glycosyltransferase involved in cell wall biosynthesis
MVKLGHQVLVISPSQENHTKMIEMNGVKVLYAPSIDLRFIDNSLLIAHSYRRLVRKVFRDIRPDIIHCQDSAPLSSCLIAEARRHGLKSMATNHPGPEVTSYFTASSSTLSSIVEYVSWHWIIRFLNTVDLVTAPSKAAASMVKGHGLKRPVKAVSCGVNLDAFYFNPNVDRTAVRTRYGLDPAKTVVIFTGRLDGEKRLDSLVKALKYIQNPNVQVAIAGKGLLGSDLIALAKRLGVQDRVKFLGLVPHNDLPDLLNSSDVFLMSGDVESLSISTLEAMASGLPVLAANANALPELITDGENGYLFKPRDPVDIARCIDRIASEPDRWSEMGQSSLVRISAHNIQKTLKTYEQIYLDLIADKNYDFARTWPYLPKKRAGGHSN